ncbi:hypothetical protein FLP30_10870 [Acetobacter vaccinii]|uniref:Uncharacterized protein n=1 Tax=Acetobacter vaccinii TaxID=2592655 RepID=A0A5C1YT42_9PROT|nr:hypothetical protein FLP30_10870 [Acetobacter vaccinii]
MVRLSTNTSGQRYALSLTTQNATVVLSKVMSDTNGRASKKVDQKSLTGLLVSTVGTPPTLMRIGRANSVYNYRPRPISGNNQRRNMKNRSVLPIIYLIYKAKIRALRIQSMIFQCLQFVRSDLHHRV